MPLVKVFGAFDLLVFASSDAPALQDRVNRWIAEVRPYIKQVYQSILSDGCIVLSIFYEKQSSEHFTDGKIRYMKGDCDAYPEA